MSGNPASLTGWRAATAAIVHDTPGVTRDRQALDAEYEGLALTPDRYRRF